LLLSDGAKFDSFVGAAPSFVTWTLFDTDSDTFDYFTSYGSMFSSQNDDDLKCPSYSYYTKLLFFAKLCAYVKRLLFPAHSSISSSKSQLLLVFSYLFFYLKNFIKAALLPARLRTLALYPRATVSLKSKKPTKLFNLPPLSDFFTRARSKESLSDSFTSYKYRSELAFSSFALPSETLNTSVFEPSKRNIFSKSIKKASSSDEECCYKFFEGGVANLYSFIRSSASKQFGKAIFDKPLFFVSNAELKPQKLPYRSHKKKHYPKDGYKIVDDVFDAMSLEYLPEGLAGTMAGSITARERLETGFFKTSYEREALIDSINKFRSSTTRSEIKKTLAFAPTLLRLRVEDL